MIINLHRFASRGMKKGVRKILWELFTALDHHLIAEKCIDEKKVEHLWSHDAFDALERIAIFVIGNHTHSNAKENSFLIYGGRTCSTISLESLITAANFNLIILPTTYVQLMQPY